MKNRLDAIIQREQALYLNTLLPPRDTLLAEMEAYSAKHHVPSSDPEVALFLEITARAIGAKRALEIGTAIGYGAITLARAMSAEGRVTTIDPSEERLRTAREFMRRAGVERQIEMVQDKALDALPRLLLPVSLERRDDLPIRLARRRISRQRQLDRASARRRARSPVGGEGAHQEPRGSNG